MDDEPDDRGHKGQVFHSSPTCEENGGNENPRAREKEAEPAPCAPSVTVPANDLAGWIEETF